MQSDLARLWTQPCRRPSIEVFHNSNYTAKQTSTHYNFIHNNIIKDLHIASMKTTPLLKLVGDRHRYQVYSIVFVCLKWLVVSLTVFLPSYLLMTPTFTCGQDKLVLQIDACQKIALCTLDHPFTITAYAGLYCGEKYTRNSIISAEFIGSIVGLVLLSILADKLGSFLSFCRYSLPYSLQVLIGLSFTGRKIIIVSTLFLTAIGAMLLTIGTHYHVIPLLFVGIILMGFGGYSLSMVSYSYLSQINNDIWRQKSLVLTYSFWAVGEIMVYPIVVYLQHWELICFYIFILPLLLLLVMSAVIVETPQFLFVQGKYPQCLNSLNYIAKFNQMDPLRSLSAVEFNQKSDKDRKQQNTQKQKDGQSLEKAQVRSHSSNPSNHSQQIQLTDTFTKPKYLLPLVVLSVAQICNNAYYYTAQYSLDTYGYRFQLNMLVIGCLELMSCLVTNYYCERMMRKRWIVIFMCLSGSMGVIIELANPGQVGQIICLGVSRVFNTVAFALFSLICSQSFPTAIKSTGMGITEAASNLGNMGAPFLVLFAQFISFKAVFIGGLINIAGGLLMILVKQTKLTEPTNSKANPLLSGQQDEDEQSSWSRDTVHIRDA